MRWEFWESLSCSRKTRGKGTASTCISVRRSSMRTAGLNSWQHGLPQKSRISHSARKTMNSYNCAGKRKSFSITSEALTSSCGMSEKTSCRLLSAYFHCYCIAFLLICHHKCIIFLIERNRKWQPYRSE